MIEKILLVPGINGTEFIRTMARFGVNTLGMRVMGAMELAETALMDSGLAVRGLVASSAERTAIIDSFLNEIPYFQSAGYADAETFMKTIEQLRMMLPADEAGLIHQQLAKGEFTDKNLAVTEVYDRYMTEMASHGYVDSVDVIRQTIESGAELTGEKRKLIVLEEFPLSRLEEELATHVSAGAVETMSFCRLLDFDKKGVQVSDYCQGYGSINEIKGMLAHIVEKEIPFDQCVIALASTTKYTGVIRDLAAEYGIDVAFGCGVPAAGCRAADLLKRFCSWRREGWQGIDALTALIFSTSFDTEKLMKDVGCDQKQLKEAIKVAGSLRLGCDHAVNGRRLSQYPDQSSEAFSIAGLLAGQLEQGVTGILRNYTKMASYETMEQAGLQAICGPLEAYRTLTGQDPLDIADDVLGKTVYREQSRPGAIYVTGINDALVSLRKNLYICGLDSSVFPGTPYENYILLDSDLELFGDHGQTSRERIRRNKQSLMDLVEAATAAGCNIWMSYAGFDLAELKEQNPSSSVYEIYRLDKGKDKTADDFMGDCRRIGYFQQPFTGAEQLARAYVQGRKAEDISEPAELSFAGKARYSPSAIGEFFQCGVRFMLNRMAGLYLEEPDDPLQVISAADFGTLAHKAMENLADGLGDTSEQLFDDFMKSRPPINEKGAEKARQDFLRTMQQAFAADPGNRVLAAEEELEADCYGVTVYGRPDRIEEYQNGKVIIVDFKTGRNVKHEKDDIETCLQAVLYAYMAEAAGYQVDHCEFRYLRNSVTVPCRYDDEMKRQLKILMEFFKHAVENQEYTLTEYPDACRYCQYGHLCGKEEG